MRVILSLIGLIFWGFATLLFMGAQSAIHEILAAVVFLAGCVLIAGASICSEIVATRNRMEDWAVQLQKDMSELKQKE